MNGCTERQADSDVRIKRQQANMQRSERTSGDITDYVSGRMDRVLDTTEVHLKGKVKERATRLLS